MVIEAKDKGGLKLVNLRTFKRALDSYINQEVSAVPPSITINLSAIATKSSKSEILKLLELVIFTTVNCSNKEVFIQKMRELDNEAQQVLMGFIKKAIGDKVDSPSSALYHSQLKELAEELSQTERALESMSVKNTELAKENDSMSLHLEDLQQQLARKELENSSPADTVAVDYESRLQSKDQQIELLKRELESIQKKHDGEIDVLADELYMARSKITDALQSEHTLKNYKKRLEKLAFIRQQAKEAETRNSELKRVIQKQKIELGDSVSLKNDLRHSRMELKTERDKSENYQFAISNKEKKLSEQKKDIDGLRKKLEFLQLTNQELENEFRRRDPELPTSEDDSQSFLHLPEEDPSTRLPVSELLQLSRQLLRKKEKIKELRESLHMSHEDFSQHFLDITCRALSAEEQQESLSAQLSEITQSFSALQNEKLRHEQLQYELEEAKASKEGTLQELKKQYEEKDELYKKYIETKDENIQAKHTLMNKEFQLREQELHDRITQEKIQVLLTREQNFIEELTELKAAKGPDSEDFKIKYMELSNEQVSLQHELHNLQSQLSEKTEQIKDLLQDREMALLQAATQHRQELGQAQEKHRRKQVKLGTDSREAIDELYKQNKQLKNQLRTERKYNPDKQNKEILQLKAELSKKGTEIELLCTANQELKQVWKETTRLLKNVWRELGSETRRIEQACQRAGE